MVDSLFEVLRLRLVDVAGAKEVGQEAGSTGMKGKKMTGSRTRKVKQRWPWCFLDNKERMGRKDMKEGSCAWLRQERA